MPSKNAMKLEY